MTIADAEYRCIKINQSNGTSDANLTAAVSAVGLDVREVLQLLPGEPFVFVCHCAQVNPRWAKRAVRYANGRKRHPAVALRNSLRVQYFKPKLRNSMPISFSIAQTYSKFASGLFNF
jgi:hypothetical protein